MELMSVMASLQLNDEGSSLKMQEDIMNVEETSDSCKNDTVPEDSRRRSTRTISKTSASVGAKRRCGRPPIKLNIVNPQTEQEIKDYYLNKKVKIKPSRLETIYEEPKESKQTEPVLMGGVKKKRALSFINSFAKAKHRKNKRMLLGRRRVEKCKFTVQDVELRLAETELRQLDTE